MGHGPCRIGTFSGNFRAWVERTTTMWLMSLQNGLGLVCRVLSRLAKRYQSLTHLCLLQGVQGRKQHDCMYPSDPIQSFVMNENTSEDVHCRDPECVTSDGDKRPHLGGLGRQVGSPTCGLITSTTLDFCIMDSGGGLHRRDIFQKPYMKPP
jgi:hypothetical protein